MAAILTLNAGSSSIKFGVYATGDDPDSLASGQVDRLGPEARLILEAGDGREERAVEAADHRAGVAAILAAIRPATAGREVAGVGHRVVHGGTGFDAPAELTAEVRDRLAELVPLAPLHQPHNLAAVEAAVAAFPCALQVGCFDTAFHRGHPFVADAFALPRRFYDEGVRRYGFHGLSYDYIAGRLAAEHPALHAGRVVVAHLGNGASMCALRGGRSIASSMGFSALDGLPMGTRCGQIDPGVLLYLMDRGMGAEDFTRLLYRESGLLGLSGVSHDMRTLLASSDPRAAEALAYYAHRIGREIGAMAAELGGLDALVFTGGVGQNAAPIRARALAGLGWMGLAVDAEANDAGAGEIGAGEVPVLVIPTDEERVIARAVQAALSAR
ncbi:MAG: acetate/propionate family kinase [Paracoccaceae bacterium]|jgi:acetate kinase|nr:acetate/propionate family kinase [Paracoccaceae bacterium]